MGTEAVTKPSTSLRGCMHACMHACVCVCAGVCVCVCVNVCVCVCVCVNHLCAKVSFFCLSINQGSLHLQGHWALLGRPNAMKLCLGVGSSSGR